MKVKISNKDGKYSLIGLREEEGTDEFPAVAAGFEREEGKILRVSSTEEQPYIVANFTADGKFVGGSTISNSKYQAIIEGAEKAGLEIDHLAWLSEK